MADEPVPQPQEKPICFVIMPIGELPDRPATHFAKVYRQILKPACDQAGYKPIRADDVRQTNDIHIDILNKIINAPMAICDLSGLNPNVMFELGIRQAFDKPVVLIREVGTKNVFDIGSLRYTEYRKERIHDELLEDVDNIKQAIEATRDAIGQKDGINSIVRLLAVSQAATLPNIGETPAAALLELVKSELDGLRTEVRSLAKPSKPSFRPNFNPALYQARVEQYAGGSKGIRIITDHFGCTFNETISMIEKAASERRTSIHEVVNYALAHADDRAALEKFFGLPPSPG